MKKLTATLLATTLVSLAAFAQGTVNFVNLGAGLNAPVFMSDGTTKVGTTGFTAELLAGTSAGTLASVATANFVAGGYFQGSPATVAIGSVAPGATAFLQVRVFSASSGSFAAAQTANLANTWGQSGVFSVVTGGAGSPPTTPSPLAGLTSFNLNSGVVPEPSSLALAGLGAAALLVFRRRK